MLCSNAHNMHKTMLCLRSSACRSRLVRRRVLTADAARQCPPCEGPRGPGPGHRHGVAGGRPSIPTRRAPGWRPPGVTRTAPSTRTLDGTARRHLRMLFQRAWPAALSAQYHCSVSWVLLVLLAVYVRAVHTYCAGRAIVPAPECRGRLQRAGLYPPLQRPTTVRCTRECDWLCVTAAHTRLGDDYIRRPRQSGPSPHPYST